MKREKLSLGSIKNVLSRAELKKLMAGSGPGTTCCLCFYVSGPNSSSTYVYDPNNIACYDFCMSNGYKGGGQQTSLSNCPGH